MTSEMAPIDVKNATLLADTAVRYAFEKVGNAEFRRLPVNPRDKTLIPTVKVEIGGQVVGAARVTSDDKGIIGKLEMFIYPTATSDKAALRIAGERFNAFADGSDEKHRMSGKPPGVTMNHKSGLKNLTAGKISDMVDGVNDFLAKQDTVVKPIPTNDVAVEF